jgi:signal transduction histidine kinase
MNMLNNKKIGPILFKKIFLGYVLIATIFTGYHIYIEYSLAKKFVLKDMKTIEKAFYNGIANSVWHLDEEQINSNAQALKSIQGIIGVSIISSNDEVLVQVGSLSVDDKKYTSFVYEQNQNITFEKKLIKHSFDITHEEFSPGESLGTVFIYTSENAIYSIVKNSLIFILIYSFMIIIVLWLLFNHFSNKLLTQPLNQIIKATKDFNIKEYKEITLDIHTTQKSELNTLVDTFNIMSQRIAESFSKLKKQKKELIEANQYQTEFLANISHELKTPLNSINVISSVMSKNKDHNLNEKQIQNMHIINKSGQDLLGMINDILDISKLEAGELQLSIETFSIQELLIGLYERMSPLAKEKNITLTQKSTLENYTITSDKKIITHVVQNLLSNAIKFTNEGGIQLKISENEHFIIINVIDTGIGIPSNKIETIFDRFKQVDGSTTRKYGGTGLGLAISKDFSLFIKGELTVTSEFSKGSDFQFVFPKDSSNSKTKILTHDNADNKPKVPEITEIERVLQDNDESAHNKKINVLLYNSNPIVFFSLIVSLKKLENINLLAINTEIELFSQLELNQFKILILDTKSLTVSLEEALKNNVNITVIGVGDTEEKNVSFDHIVPKSVELKTLVNLFE